MLRHLPGHLVATGRLTQSFQILTDFGYHYQRFSAFGRVDVTRVIEDLVSLQRAGELPAEQSAVVVSWLRFYGRAAHLMVREEKHIPPEQCLLELAIAHADTSPVTAAAENWLELDCRSGLWLRALRRPHTAEPTACLRTLEGHEGPVGGVTFCGDGRRVLSAGGNDTLKLWDTETGACLHTVQHATLWKVMNHPDGHRAVSAGWNGTLKIWDIETGACLRTLGDPKNTGQRSLTALALDQDGRRAVIASDKPDLKIWDLDSDVCLHTLAGHTSKVAAVAVHADGYARYFFKAFLQSGFLR